MSVDEPQSRKDNMERPFGSNSDRIKEHFKDLTRQHEELLSISQQLDSKYDNVAPEHEFDNPNQFLDNFPSIFASDVPTISDWRSKVTNIGRTLDAVHELTRELAEDLYTHSSEPQDGTGTSTYSDQQSSLRSRLSKDSKRTTSKRFWIDPALSAKGPHTNSSRSHNSRPLSADRSSSRSPWPSRGSPYRGPTPSSESNQK